MRLATRSAVSTWRSPSLQNQITARKQIGTSRGTGNNLVKIGIVFANLLANFSYLFDVSPGLLLLHLSSKFLKFLSHATTCHRGLFKQKLSETTSFNLLQVVQSLDELKESDWKLKWNQSGTISVGKWKSLCQRFLDGSSAQANGC